MKTQKVVEFFESKGFKIKSNVVHRGQIFTVAEAVLTKPNGSKKAPKVVLWGEGIARKSPSQEYAALIGEGTAMNRAVEAVFKKFTRKNREVHSWCEG